MTNQKPDYTKCRILTFRGKGLISTLIRWQTRGDVSHAAILLPDGETIVEAWQGEGVRTKKMTDWKDVRIYAIPTMSAVQWEKAVDFALQQVGRRYDYWAIVRFITREVMPQNDDWFCSELVFQACVEGGCQLLLRILSSAVSPGTLETSPLMAEDTPMMNEKNL